VKEGEDVSKHKLKERRNYGGKEKERRRKKKKEEGNNNNNKGKKEGRSDKFLKLLLKEERLVIERNPHILFCDRKEKEK
jgi:hypothetical protein